MIQRSRIAPLSDAAALRQRGGKGALRPGQAALRHVAVIVLVAVAIYGLTELLGPSFFRRQFNGVVASAAIAGEWVRNALVVAFASIPVR